MVSASTASRTLLKAAISVAALIVAFYNLNLSDVLQVAAEITWPILGMAVLLSLVSVSLLGLRWDRLLSSMARSTLSVAVVAQYIGLFGNNVFPLRIGEIIRAQYMAARLSIGFLKVLATIFLERLFDLVVVAGVFGFLLLVGTVSGDDLKEGTYVIIGIVAVLSAPLVIWAGRPLVVSLLIRKFGQSSSSTRWIGDLLRGRTIGLAMAVSILIWAVYACRFQVVLLSIGLPMDISLVALLIVATVVGFMIPAAPGAIGTYHLAVVFAMHNLYGIALPQAQVAAVLLHLSSYMPATIIGGFFFIKSRFRPEIADPERERRFTQSSVGPN